MTATASPEPLHRPPTATPRRVLLHLVVCVRLALGASLNQLFSLSPRHRRGVRRFETHLDLERFHTQFRLLADWFGRSRHRPRFTRREWIRILEYGERWQLTTAQLARDFNVSVAAVHRWRKRRRERWFDTHPERPPPMPPCPRIGDRSRETVADMAYAGFGGDRTISNHLRLQGERVSARSVKRFRLNPRQATTPLEKRRRQKLRKPAHVLDACAAALALPLPLRRPRLTRLLRHLSEAFVQGIAADTLRRCQDEWLEVMTEDGADQHALLRTRRAQQLALLYARLLRIPSRQRPRYTDVERADILTFKYRYGLSHQELADCFLLDPGTLSAWTRDLDHPHERGRPLVQPLPDLDAALASVSAILPPVPNRLRQTVADTLAALAGKLSRPKRRTRKPRQRKERRLAAPRRARNLAPIRARYPNHWWSTDLTVIRLGQDFHLSAIVDLYSRDVLAWELFPSQPDSPQIRILYEEAVARHGPPQNFVSDQGKQFTAAELAAAFEKHGIKPRTGAVGEHGSIAIVERLWRTTKECLDLQTVRPQVSAIVRERVAVVIDYYRTKRPHSSLRFATPHEVYHGLPSRAHSAVRAPRGWRGQPTPRLPCVIRYAFPQDRTLPYLERIA